MWALCGNPSKDIRWIESDSEYNEFISKSKKLSKLKYRSLNHVMMDLINMGEISKQVNSSNKGKRPLMYELKNLVAVEMSIITVHEVNLGTYVNM